MRRRSAPSGHFGLCPRVDPAPGSTWRKNCRPWNQAASVNSCQFQPQGPSGYKLTKLYVSLCWNKKTNWMVEKEVKRKFVQV
ncbi:zinc finger protein OZF isoform X3 [Manis javanica]|uniref:zinc finger protein OZF isoform X3 n=1 Tax=Manis javanica TaxID=9974 RepID=UPI0018791764|nr:zinc finger protein OZF isoform X2 [Manis javanica]XP_036877315.1 zinc finger protein OZF isoform X3 [Manis javanica]